jgi:hypothetical protein
MERRAPERPDFEPDVITLLDFLSKWIRKRFFERVSNNRRAMLFVFCMWLAYAYPY